MAKGNQNSERYQEFAKGLKRGFLYRLRSKFPAYLNKWPLYAQSAAPKKKKEDSPPRESDPLRFSSPSKQFDLQLRETHRIEEGASEDEASASSSSQESIRDLNQSLRRESKKAMFLTAAPVASEMPFALASEPKPEPKKEPIILEV